MSDSSGIPKDTIMLSFSGHGGTQVDATLQVPTSLASAMLLVPQFEPSIRVKDNLSPLPSRLSIKILCIFLSRTSLYITINQLIHLQSEFIFEVAIRKPSLAHHIYLHFNGTCLV